MAVTDGPNANGILIGLAFETFEMTDQIQTEIAHPQLAWRQALIHRRRRCRGRRGQQGRANVFAYGDQSVAELGRDFPQPCFLGFQQTGLQCRA